jgi:hypothetical protein
VRSPARRGFDRKRAAPQAPYKVDQARYVQPAGGSRDPLLAFAIHRFTIGMPKTRVPYIPRRLRVCWKSGPEPRCRYEEQRRGAKPKHHGLEACHGRPRRPKGQDTAGAYAGHRRAKAVVHNAFRISRSHRACRRALSRQVRGERAVVRRRNRGGILLVLSAIKWHIPSATPRAARIVNCPPFRPDSWRKQEGSRISLRIGLCRRTISGSS